MDQRNLIKVCSTIDMRLLGWFIIVSCISIIMTALAEEISDEDILGNISDEDQVPRIKIKVFRGPTEEINGEQFAKWGFWIKQPSS